MSDIAQNLESILKKIRKSEKIAAREQGSTQLIAVTKTQSVQTLTVALAFGHRLFGENKVQEAQSHWAELKKQYPDIKLHLIGPLQSNKAADAVALFDCIETLDREKLAAALSGEMKKAEQGHPCFIQVNTGEEEQKAGIAPSALPEFLSYCTKECGLTVTGLMCIPPADEPAALHFALLKKLAAQTGLKNLSMGMSADFEKGVALGATHVRVGSALFGERT